MSNEIQTTALMYALQYRGTTAMTPTEVVEVARTFEDFLRGDREYNNKLNAVIDTAIAIAMEANAHPDGFVSPEDLQVLVNKVRDAGQTLPPKATK